jgi:hypothetical protein
MKRSSGIGRLYRGTERATVQQGWSGCQGLVESEDKWQIEEKIEKSSNVQMQTKQR